MRWAKGANSATNLSAGTGQMRPSARRVGRCWTLVRAVPRNNAIGRSWHGPRATASATANPTQQKAIRYSVSKRTASRRPYKQDLLHYVHADPRNPFGHRQRRRKGRTTDDADSADERRVIRGSAGSPLAAARTRSKAPTTEGRPTQKPATGHVNKSGNLLVNLSPAQQPEPRRVLCGGRRGQIRPRI